MTDKNKAIALARFAQKLGRLAEFTMDLVVLPDKTDQDKLLLEECWKLIKEKEDE